MSTPVDNPAIAAADDRPAFLPPVTPSAADKPIAGTRPELLVAGAFAGGLILAKILGRVRGN